MRITTFSFHKNEMRLSLENKVLLRDAARIVGDIYGRSIGNDKIGICDITHFIQSPIEDEGRYALYDLRANGYLRGFLFIVEGNLRSGSCDYLVRRLFAPKRDYLALEAELMKLQKEQILIEYVCF